MNHSVSASKSPRLIPISLLFCMLVIVAHFASNHTFSLFGTLLSKRVFIFPATLILCGICLDLFGHERAQRVIAYGIFCQITVALFSQFTLTDVELIKTAWFIPLASCLSILLSQHANLYILSDPNGLFEQKPLWIKQNLAIFLGVLTDLLMSLILIPHQATTLKPSLGFFTLTLFVSLSTSAILLHFAPHFIRLLDRRAIEANQESDPVFSWKVIVAKEPSMPREANNVGFLTERE